ncbi:hypothetical protein SASPL_147213 [Salvia splendens]|uniref:Uncharacterized protein n=1 Tax=Salvia splendens TaxID=180675 RepID=A0A8X8Z6A8_SALSN|nr:hypothetical protein SASPL_147213 [Salvia splendens]
MKVSTIKTTISFSKYVKNATRRNSKELLGMLEVESLGKYLGVPLLHRRVNKNTDAYIVDKMKGKIANCTACRMSLTGRVTLAQSVLSTMPIYAMQTTKIPIGTCDDMEKVIRDFVWRKTEDKNRFDPITPGDQAKKVMFWIHRWGPNMRSSLSEVAVSVKPDHLMYKTVDFFVDSSGWAWDMFERFIPAEVASIIAANC